MSEVRWNNFPIQLILHFFLPKKNPHSFYRSLSQILYQSWVKIWLASVLYLHLNVEFIESRMNDECFIELETA